jgi:hypothetical protein
MRRRYTPLAITSALLLCASFVYVLGGFHVYQAYQRAYPDWASATGPCGALITWSPPKILYTGLYVNQPSLLTLRYRSPQPQSLEISVSIPQFTQGQTIQVQATPEFQSLTFKPLTLNDSVLDALVGPGQRTAELRLHIENSNSVVCDISSTVVLKSPEWMLWSDGGNNIDNAPYLAGWVTPEAKVIRDLIGATTQWIADNPQLYPDINTLMGYSGGATAKQVEEEVNAIFDTLQFVYHLNYASDTFLYMQNNAQLVQLPSDILSLAHPSGMCVETTAIMASAVEYLRMRPYFIILPQHAFLGVALGPSGVDRAYWETSDLSGGANSDRSTGAQANIRGDSEYLQNQNSILYVVDVQYERQQGILPIE